MNWFTALSGSFWFPYIVAFGVVTLIQLLYFWVVFSRFAFFNGKKQALTTEQPPVSVVICAKNEYHNLIRFLPHVLAQNYPEFEVIVVNDASDDDTLFLLKDMEEKEPRLKVINIAQNLNFFHGKKFPLSIGIKSSRFDRVLLTDADCVPAGPDWLAHMQSCYADGKDIVLGYGAYNAQPGLLNRIIRFETLHVALQYFSFALAGMPYMGVGRNLSYKTGLFFTHGGFIDHYQVPSGDDDLFINVATNRHNTAIQPNPEAFTFSKPKQTFSSWLSQKRRHLSTGKYYKAGHKFMLGMFSLTQFLFYAGFIALLVLGADWKVLTGLFLLRLISQLIIYRKTMRRLQEKGFLLLIPFFEIYLILINGWTGFWSWVNPPHRW